MAEEIVQYTAVNPDGLAAGSTAGTKANLSFIETAQLQSRSDLVTHAIRDAILSRRFGRGEMLVERRLASSLGVSKTPVREALIQLARKGLVTSIPNRGMMVRELKAKDLRSIYEVRLRLEPWAVGRSAHAEPGDVLLRGQMALERAHAAAERGDRVAESLANREFHRIVHSRCKNELVCSMLEDIQDQVALGVLTLLWPEWPTWGAEAVEHAAILEAVAEKRADDAERLMQDHIQRSIDRLDAEYPVSNDEVVAS